MKHDRNKDGGMVISSDNRSLQRGRRRAARTEVCRPSLIWLPEDPNDQIEAVVLDLNPRGMRIRMLDEFPAGTELMVQLMRDEDFQVPLSQPLRVLVVRVGTSPDGFFDHGTSLQVAKIRKASGARPIRIARPNVSLSSVHRMFTATDRGQKRGR